MNSAELILTCLQKAGVEVVFGIPGEENTDFMMALEALDLDFVLTRHEQGAAFMAPRCLFFHALAWCLESIDGCGGCFSRLRTHDRSDGASGSGPP